MTRKFSIKNGKARGRFLSGARPARGDGGLRPLVLLFGLHIHDLDLLGFGEKVLLEVFRRPVTLWTVGELSGSSLLEEMKVSALGVRAARSWDRLGLLLHVHREVRKLVDSIEAVHILLLSVTNPAPLTEWGSDHLASAVPANALVVEKILLRFLSGEEPITLLRMGSCCFSLVFHATILLSQCAGEFFSQYIIFGDKSQKQKTPPCESVF